MDQAENLRKIMQQKEEQAKEAARVIAVTSMDESDSILSLAEIRHNPHIPH